MVSDGLPTRLSLMYTNSGIVDPGGLHLRTNTQPYPNGGSLISNYDDDRLMIEVNQYSGPFQFVSISLTGQDAHVIILLNIIHKENSWRQFFLVQFIIDMYAC